jgi:hypothetical protein
MFTAADARKNRRHDVIDKILESIKEVSTSGSSLYVCFNNGQYPVLTSEEARAVEYVLDICGYGFVWDWDSDGYKTLSINWYE